MDTSKPKFWIYTILIAVVVLGFLLWFGPNYNVWTQSMTGEAVLQRAEQEKKIIIEQARAEVESAKLRAEAIKIVGQATKDFPEYRTQEFIGAFAEALKEGNVAQIIYVPTEANIPITESSRAVR